MMSTKFYPLLTNFIGEEPENFESYSLDSWPASWIKDANANDAANNKIVQDPENPTNKVLRLYGSLGGCWGAITDHPCEFPSEFYVEAKIYNGSESLSGCHPGRGGFGMQQGTSWTNYGFGLTQFENSILSGPGITLLPSYELNRWYNLKAHYILLGNQVTLSYWVDGQYCGQAIRSVDPAQQLTLNHFLLVSQEGSALFDDIVVYEHPLTVLFPNGGETIVAGSVQKITWDRIALAGMQNVSIEYSSNDGLIWQTVASTTPNDGEYDWTLPAITSNQCRIRISDADNSEASDISDGVFSIFECLDEFSMDFNHDCYVNLADFVEFASQWLSCANPLDPTCASFMLHKGLLAYYPLDGNVNDVSGNGNNGTAYNNYEYLDGVSSNAIRLVGSGHTGYEGGYVLFPFIALNEIPAFTISLWVNHEDSTSWGGNSFIQFGGSTDPVGGGYWVNITYGTNFPNCSLDFSIGGSGVGGGVSTPYTPSLINNWNHLVLRADNGTLTAFLNGQPIGSDSYQLGVMTPTAGLGVSWFNSGGTESTRFTGSIDEVRIYNRALTGLEVQNLYQNP